MNKKKVILIILLLFLVLSAGFAYSQNNDEENRSLEIDYPEIKDLKPETVAFPITQYFKYIFYFIIGATASASFIFIIRGIYFIISAASPEQIKEARNSLWSVILGILILFSAWLILNSINPELIKFRLPSLEEIPETPPLQIKEHFATSKVFLDRIKDLMEEIKSLPPEIEKTMMGIKNLTDKCQCLYTSSVVLCSGGSTGSICRAHQCYVGSGKESENDQTENTTSPGETSQSNNSCENEITSSHPCSDIKTIKELQKNIVDQKDTILYYKNRTSVESKDLYNDIQLILGKKIEYYQDLIEKENDKDEPDDTRIKQWQEKLDNLRKEELYKLAIIKELDALSQSLTIKTANVLKLLSQLPDKCFSNVAEECKPLSQTGKDYGCHDKLCGCQPEQCEGLNDPNPCPTKDIKKEVNAAKQLMSEINKTCDKITAIINNI